MLPFRRVSYEIFLRIHQALAVVAAYCLWRHTINASDISRLCLYALVGVPALTTSLEVLKTLHRNVALGKPYPRAVIIKVKETACIELSTPRPWVVRAGQYVNVWIPSIGFWQSHPFMIVGWTKGFLILVVEPREGLTRKLVARAAEFESGLPDLQRRLAFFTGPHGRCVSMGEHDSVLLVTSGFGVAAQLPYIKQLVHGYQQGKVKTRRIHLVWQLQSLGGYMIKCKLGLAESL